MVADNGPTAIRHNLLGEDRVRIEQVGEFVACGVDRVAVQDPSERDRGSARITHTATAVAIEKVPELDTGRDLGHPPAMAGLDPGLGEVAQQLWRVARSGRAVVDDDNDRGTGVLALAHRFQHACQTTGLVRVGGGVDVEPGHRADHLDTVLRGVGAERRHNQ